MASHLDPNSDPHLAQATRRWHLALFIAGTLLTLPGAAVILLATYVVRDIPASVLSGDDWMYFSSAVAVTVAGVLAWISLGVLFMRPASPTYHRRAWSLTLLFGILAIPGSLHWLLAGRLTVDPWIKLILALVLICGLVATAIGARFRTMARRSQMIRG